MVALARRRVRTPGRGGSSGPDGAIAACLRRIASRPYKARRLSGCGRFFSWCPDNVRYQDARPCRLRRFSRIASAESEGAIAWAGPVPAGWDGRAECRRLGWRVGGAAAARALSWSPVRIGTTTRERVRWDLSPASGAVVEGVTVGTGRTGDSQRPVVDAVRRWGGRIGRGEHRPRSGRLVRRAEGATRHEEGESLTDETVIAPQA